MPSRLQRATTWALMAILLAVIPYFVFRWIVECIASRWLAHRAAHPVP
jgi:hypothetical protein